MTPNASASHTEVKEKNGVIAKATEDEVDMEPVLEALRPRSLYHAVQLLLQCISAFVIAFPILGVVFIGYRPEYRCNDVNSTQLDALLGRDVPPNATVSLEYQKCTIDVTLNNSGVVTSHSLSCVNGINFSMPSETSFLTEWSLVCDKAGLTELSQTIIMLGLAIGAAVFSNLSDLYGRKKIYVICSLTALVTSSGASVAPNYYVLLVSRVLTGATIMGMSMASSTMFVELLPQEWRSASNPIRDILWSVASIIMALAAYLLQGISWRYMNLIFTVAYVSCLLLPCFLDESVRWLMATGNIAEVERILEKACRLNGKDFHHVKKVLHDAIIKSRQKHNPSAAAAVPSNDTSEDADAPCKKMLGDVNCGRLDTTSCQDKEIDIELSAVEEQSGVPKYEDDEPETELKPAKYTFLDICKHRVVLVPVAITTCIWTTNSLFYYGAMLGSASLAGNRFLNFGLFSLLEIIANAMSAFILPRFNRRTLGIFFGMVCSLSLFFSVAMMQLVGGSIGKTLATVGWFVGKFSLSGSYCVLFIFSLEVFPTCVRTTGRGTAGTISRFSGMIAPYVVLLGEQTPWAPGLMIGTFCFLATFTICLLPETRHRKLPTTIEEVKAWKTTTCNIGKAAAEKALI